jgi:tRNA A37 methylthiotransferase MiaB
MKYFIKTFGCQQNKADSERIAAAFEARGMKPAKAMLMLIILSSIPVWSASQPKIEFMDWLIIFPN